MVVTLEPNSDGTFTATFTDQVFNEGTGSMDISPRGSVTGTLAELRQVVSTLSNVLSKF